MFKVGDKVRAITNKYGITTEHEEWEGKVLEANGRTFDAITLNHKEKRRIGKEYYDLEYKDFELIEPSGLEGAVRLI